MNQKQYQNILESNPEVLAVTRLITQRVIYKTWSNTLRTPDAVILSYELLANGSVVNEAMAQLVMNNDLEGLYQLKENLENSGELSMVCPRCNWTARIEKRKAGYYYCTKCQIKIDQCGQEL